VKSNNKESYILNSLLRKYTRGMNKSESAVR